MSVSDSKPKTESVLSAPPVERAAKASAVIVLRWATLAFFAILFIALSGGLLAESLVWLDGPIVSSVSSLRSDGLTRLMRTITWFGNANVLTGVATLATLGLWFLRYQRPALFVALSAAGSGLLNTVLKALFARDRPHLLLQLSSADGFAYPSGHAMAGASIYGAIALVAVLRFPRLGYATLIFASLFVVALGFSRIYLGVHYPSDVLAGWALGLSWPLWLQPLLVAKSSTVKP